MNDPADRCDVYVDGAWLTVSLAEAHRSYREADKRCPNCGDAVRTSGGYTFGGRTTMAHVSAQSGRVIRGGACSAARPRSPNRPIAVAVAGVVALLSVGTAQAAQPDSLSALILAADAFVADQCPGLSVDAGLSTATLRNAGTKTGDAASPALKAEVASWLTEWRGNPKAACDGLLKSFGPDGRTVRNLIYRTRHGA